ncbi:MAG: aldo/keto reductase [Halofilum sp. (in: g-proteobacteria)]|nr:aldo/keto reductase [Halofilum sp. (in: g-proteobacteria)]
MGATHQRRRDRTSCGYRQRAHAALGQGTWHMGERASERAREVRAVRAGIDLGLTLVGTRPEMYGDGEAERMVRGEAIAGRRDELFWWPALRRSATRAGVAAACERSLRRLGTDRIDLYLLHWRGHADLADAVAGFRDLEQAGKIVRWGVSNLDRGDMDDLWAVTGGEEVATNQLLYHLGERGIEAELLPWLRAHGIPVMAYAPLGQGRLLRQRALIDFARRLELTPAQVGLAWLLARDDTIAIPKSSDPERLAENRAAADVRLSAEQLIELDELFPAPGGDPPLAIL